MYRDAVFFFYFSLHAHHTEACAPHEKHLALQLHQLALILLHGGNGIIKRAQVFAAPVFLENENRLVLLRPLFLPCFTAYNLAIDSERM